MGQLRDTDRRVLTALSSIYAATGSPEISTGMFRDLPARLRMTREVLESSLFALADGCHVALARADGAERDYLVRLTVDGREAALRQQIENYADLRQRVIRAVRHRHGIEVASLALRSGCPEFIVLHVLEWLAAKGYIALSNAGNRVDGVRPALARLVDDGRRTALSR